MILLLIDSNFQPMQRRRRASRCHRVLCHRTAPATSTCSGRPTSGSSTTWPSLSGTCWQSFKISYSIPVHLLVLSCSALPRRGTSLGRAYFNRPRVSVQLYCPEFESWMWHKVVGKSQQRHLLNVEIRALFGNLKKERKRFVHSLSN